MLRHGGSRNIGRKFMSRSFGPGMIRLMSGKRSDSGYCLIFWVCSNFVFFFLKSVCWVGVLGWICCVGLASEGL